MNAAPAGPTAELGRFLEIQNLGLNLPFALAFLLLAARGVPSLVTTGLLVLAFVAARNAGHSFNRFADREQDARNPRTRGRALVTGRLSPAFALVFTAVSAAVMVLAAALLNPLALALAPVALVLILGYSYTKRFTWLTTVFLGLVESITPAAAYVGVTGTLAPTVLLAVGAILLWGTAFETIHSLGDLPADLALGLRSLPARFGVRRSVALVPVLHAGALALLAAFGAAERLGLAYFVALAAMGALAARTDRVLALRPEEAARPFRAHFALGALFLAGILIALFVPFP